MTISQSMPAAAFNDAECVSRSLAGDRAAFARIVTQYQSLICSLAYSATGNLPQSEELAQETFLIAWRKLRDLRDSDKLRPWLCGIARHLIGTAFRRQGREPTHQAESLETAQGMFAPGPSPAEAAVSDEEAAILWRSLERIPEIYREPLILFYRESESTERVAEILDLSPDTARQRLSRGRKLLQEEVTGFVEGALRRSAPGIPFTAGVLSALPMAGAAAGAAALGASAKAGGVAKAATALGWAGVAAGPVLSLVGGYFGYRLSLASAQSEEERHFVRKFTRGLWVSIIGTWLVIFPVLMIWGEALVLRHQWLLFVLMNLTFLTLLALMRSTRASIERQQPRFAAARAAAGSVRSAGWTYRSRQSFLGLPLVNIQLTSDLAASQEPVRGWIAIGGSAIGGLFAFGGMAIAPISCGGLALGGIAVGGCSAGLLAAGGFAAGIWAFGGMAEGWQAAGGLVLGWKAAIGGLACAHEFAVGGMVHALHANDAAARDFVRQQFFYRNPKTARALLWWGPALIWLPPILVMGWLQRRNRRRLPAA
jgi:RNA polymerase sigma factor (sigma-70 family)